MKDSSEILTSRGFASNCDSHILFLLFGLHDFFCRGVNFLFIKSLCRFCVSQPLEEILNEVSDLLCSSGKVELKDQISTDWEMRTSLFGEVFLCLFFFVSSFIQRRCGAFRLGCNKPQSERGSSLAPRLSCPTPPPPDLIRLSIFLGSVSNRLVTEAGG